MLFHFIKFVKSLGGAAQGWCGGSPFIRGQVPRLCLHLKVRRRHSFRYIPTCRRGEPAGGGGSLQEVGGSLQEGGACRRGEGAVEPQQKLHKLLLLLIVQASSRDCTLLQGGLGSVAAQTGVQPRWPSLRGDCGSGLCHGGWRGVLPTWKAPQDARSEKAGHMYVFNMIPLLCNVFQYPPNKPMTF